MTLSFYGKFAQADFYGVVLCLHSTILKYCEELRDIADGKFLRWLLNGKCSYISEYWYN